ncbi:uncharacterized protein LOC121377925 [Gigantopelta aegis]|uniref:uncharacterized protein LOC121377925 n=1 Tax=Gigantopelta aegis TaxID=1735272 RepID=UPI001B8896BE|nr:uncharacterized protein LOC121377925 [Gigantopelta aegis]
MDTFLRKRWVDNRTIDKLKEDKIDEDVARLMDDEQLTQYLSKPGDIIALRHFLKPSVPDQTRIRKHSLMEQLNSRLEMHDRNPDAPQSSVKLARYNAMKNTHIIELGWMHYNEKRHQYAQVRTKKGVGTRSISLDKKSTKTDIITEAKKLFFPGDESSLGSLKDRKLN